VSSALAGRAINVKVMTTGISGAPMTGEALFNANAEIEIPDEVDIDDLNDQLEAIANELTVDISLEKPD
jgi:glycine cleavage system regulatory protein